MAFWYTLNIEIGLSVQKIRKIDLTLIAIYFSVDLDRNCGRSLSVQINRKIDLIRVRSIFLIFWTDRQISIFRVYQFAKSCGFSPYFHILFTIKTMQRLGKKHYDRWWWYFWFLITEIARNSDFIHLNRQVWKTI